MIRRNALNLLRLEDRLVPAGSPTLISRPDLSFVNDSANGASVGGAISEDGRFVAFTSLATNLVAGITDNNNQKDVYLLDRLTNTTTLVSHKAGDISTAATATTFYDPPIKISGNGRYVLFGSLASDLVAGFVENNRSVDPDIYLYDRLTGVNTLVSHDAQNPNAGCNQALDTSYMDFSADGGEIAFSSNSTNLISGFAGPQLGNVFLYDTATNTLNLLSGSNGLGTVGANGGSGRAHISSDGNAVSFYSYATDLVSGFVDANGSGSYDAYVFDRLNNTVKLVSHAAGLPNTSGDQWSDAGPISADGRYIAFASTAATLVSGQAPGGSETGNTYLFDRLTDTTRLISHVPGDPLQSVHGFTWPRAITADGRSLLIASQAPDFLNITFTAGTPAELLYLADAVTGNVTLVSHTFESLTTGVDRSTFAARMSLDGKTVVFTSSASNLVNIGTITPPLRDNAYRYDAASGTITLLSHAAGSATAVGNSASTSTDISADGHWIFFTSGSSNLLTTPDSNTSNDVFVTDATNNTTSLVSQRSAATALIANNGSGQQYAQRQRVSDDGRYVVFVGNTTNLVPGQISVTNRTQVFLQDRSTGETILVSHALGSNVMAGNANSDNAAISGDGRYVIFNSQASNLVPLFSDLNGSGAGDMYMFDRMTGAITLVSHHYGGAYITGDKASGGFLGPEIRMSAISSDGRYVVYESAATTLINYYVSGAPLTGWGNDQLFLYDRVTNTNKLITHAPNLPTTTSNHGGDWTYDISADGQFVAFSTYSTNVMPGVTDGLFLYSTATGSVQLITHQPGLPSVSAGVGLSPTISSNGRYVAYLSQSQDLITGFTGPNSYNEYVFDRLTDTNILVSHAAGSLTAGSNGDPGGFIWSQLDVAQPAMSADGRFIAYACNATNLVPGFVDANGSIFDDVYLYDLQTGINHLITRRVGTVAMGGNLTSGPDYRGIEKLSISADGQFVAFSSQATDLVSGFVDNNGQSPPLTYTSGNNDIGNDVYLYDRLTDRNELLSHVPGQPLQSGNERSKLAQINRNGNVVVFYSQATSFAANSALYGNVFATSIATSPITLVDFGDTSTQHSVIRQIRVTFSTPVTFVGDPAAAFVVTRTGPTGATGNVTLAATMSGTSNTVVTLTFSGSLTEYQSLIDGRYSLQVLGSQVLDSLGQPLDANADGTAGGDFLYTFHRLFGDADGNGVIDGLDYAAFRTAFNTNNTIFSFDGTGPVDGLDFGQFRQRFGVVI